MAKTCFVIAPIGQEGSETRQRSDQVLRHIIAPAVEKLGYTAIRADEISEPGIITSQIIQHLIDDELVLADLTGRNPNVFYELAVRHAVKKPVIQIIQSGESLPFDVAGVRTISVDHRDLDSVAQCQDEIVNQIRAVKDDPNKVDSPISVAIDLQSLRQSDNPLEKSNAEIISMLADVTTSVGVLINRPVSDRRRAPQLRDSTVYELWNRIRVLRQVIQALADVESEEDVTRQIDELTIGIQRRFISLVREAGMQTSMASEDIKELFSEWEHDHPLNKGDF